MALITLTGPPKFVDFEGTTIQMLNHPDIDPGHFIAYRDETIWVEQSSRLMRSIEGIKYSRPFFELELGGLTDAQVSLLITALQNDPLTYFPRTRATGDSATEPEIGFQVKVTAPFRFTEHIRRGRIDIGISLEALVPVSSIASTLSILIATINPSAIANSIADFVAIINLGHYPFCSDFWDRLQSDGSNIRVRNIGGFDVPFEVGKDFHSANRAGTLYCKIQVSDSNITEFKVVAASLLVPAFPNDDDLNGKHAVWGPKKFAWHLEENPVFPPIEDSAPNEKDLTPTNMDATNIEFGQVGCGYQLNDGVTDEHLTATTPEIPSGDFCVEAWILHPASAPDLTDAAIMGMDRATVGGAGYMSLFKDAANQWSFGVINQAGSFQTINSGVITDDVLIHLFGAFFDDAGTRRLRLFVNGASVGDTVFTGVPETPVGDLVIGKRFVADVVADPWPGIIDNAVVYEGLPSSLNSINSWAKARYDQTKDSDDLIALVADIPIKFGPGWSTDPLIAWFTEQITTAKQGMAVGVIGDFIYFAGGRSGTTSLTVDRYNWRTNAWESRMSLPSAREGAAFGVINGLFYVAGGRDLGGLETNTTFEYDPVADTWATKATMINLHEGAASAVLAGELYSIAGLNTGVVSTLVEKYNPNNNTWTAVAVLPAAIAFGAAVLENGKILVSGGTNGTVPQTGTYEFEEGIGWTTKAVMTSARERHCLVEYNGTVFSIGGRTTATQSSATTEILRFDQNNTWSIETFTLPTARTYLSCGKVEPDIVFVVGGLDGSSVLRNENEAYLFANRDCPNDLERRLTVDFPVQWYETGTAANVIPAAVPGTNRRGFATGFMKDRIYLAGGEEQTPTYFDRLDIYDPYHNQWKIGAPMAQTTTAPAFGVFQNKLYVAGGFNGVAWDDDFVVYDPLTDVWAALAVVPFANVGPSGAWAANGKFYVNGGTTVRLDEYDPVADTWASKTAPPTALNLSHAIDFNSFLYWHGAVPASATLLRYDYVLDTWATMNAFPVVTTGSKFFVHASLLYVLVGRDSGAQPTGQVYVYNEGADTWALASFSPIIVPVEVPGMAVHGDRVHVFGGLNSQTGPTHTNTHQIYNFVKSWY